MHHNSPGLMMHTGLTLCTQAAAAQARLLVVESEGSSTTWQTFNRWPIIQAAWMLCHLHGGVKLA